MKESFLYERAREFEITFRFMMCTHHFLINHAIHVQEIDTRIIEQKFEFLICLKHLQNKLLIRLLFGFANDVLNVGIR